MSAKYFCKSRARTAWKSSDTTSFPKMKPLPHLAVLTLALLTAHASAQVPQTINYQGRITAVAVNFTGTGQFKFALVNAAGTTTFWSNDGTSVAGNPPTHSVGLTVTGGPMTSASTILGAAAGLVATINIAGGFLVTQRMLQMFRK